MTAARVVPMLDAEQAFRDLVREVIAVAEDLDPNALADAVLGRLTTKQVMAALAVTLPEYMRTALKKSSGVLRSADVAPSGTPSFRVARIRAQWHAIRMAEVLFTGSEYKAFGDFTAADCRAAAAIRFEQAQFNQTRGERLEEVAVRAEKHGAATVADIPADELRDVLEGVEGGAL